MKLKFILTITGISLFTSAIATAYEFPRSTFSIDKLEEAKAEATKRNKPLVFIVVNKK